MATVTACPTITTARGLEASAAATGEAVYTPGCACGWQALDYTSPTAAGQVADLHARDCPAQPPLPFTCPSRGDTPQWCPHLSRRPRPGTIPLPLLGPTCIPD